MATVPDGEERFLRGYSGRMFLLIALGVFLTNLGRQALPPLLPTIVDDLAITSAAAGVAFTLMRVSYALLQYPSGRVADAVSRMIAIMGGLIVLVASFLLLTVTTTYPLFLICMVLLGIGAAFFFVSERVLLSDLFVTNRGRAFGLNSAISRVGSILAAGLAIAVLAIGRWQLAFLPVAAALVLTGLAFHLTSREAYRADRLVRANGGTGHLRATLRRVFGTREVRWLVVAYTLIIFVWEGVLAFLPLYLETTKGFTPAIASGGFATLFAVGVVVQPLSGTVSDRWDRRIVAGAATIVSIAGLVLLLVAASTVPVVAGIVLYAAGLMAFTPVMQAYLLDIFPEESKGGDLGAFKTVYEGLSGIGPTYVGVVVGVAGFGVAFGGFLACLAVSTVAIFWLYRIDTGTST